jgi:Protein of unknown function (DUF2442)
LLDQPDTFDDANRAAKNLQACLPQARSAHFDPFTGRIVIALNSGFEVAFLPQDAEGLEGASTAELELIEISPSGLGIHFPKLDADLYVPALVLRISPPAPHA